MRFLGPTTLLAIAVASAPAHADERDRCASASEHAQDLRAAGKLRGAREALLTCTPSSCPAIVRSDCLRWLAEIDAIVPSVVVSATDPDGHDAISVRVFVDGQLLTDGLDGKAALVDPGVHLFRYELAGSAPVEEKILISEGQKDRALQVQFHRAESAPPPQASRPHAMERGATLRPPSLVLPLVFAGVGVAALGTFAVLSIEGQSQYDRCNQASAPCSKSDVNGLAVKRGIAWASGAVSVLSLGVATWLFLSRRPYAPAVALQGDPSSRGASAILCGSF